MTCIKTHYTPLHDMGSDVIHGSEPGYGTIASFSQIIHSLDSWDPWTKILNKSDRICGSIYDSCQIIKNVTQVWRDGCESDHFPLCRYQKITQIQTVLH